MQWKRTTVDANGLTFEGQKCGETNFTHTAKDKRCEIQMSEKSLSTHNEI